MEFNPKLFQVLAILDRLLKGICWNFMEVKGIRATDLYFKLLPLSQWLEFGRIWWNLVEFKHNLST